MYNTKGKKKICNNKKSVAALLKRRPLLLFQNQRTVLRPFILTCNNFTRILTSIFCRISIYKLILSYLFCFSSVVYKINRHETYYGLSCHGKIKYKRSVVAVLAYRIRGVFVSSCENWTLEKNQFSPTLLRSNNQKNNTESCDKEFDW